MTDLALRESFNLERTTDRYLQDQVFEALRQKPYLRTTWERASVEKRQEMLEQFYNEVQEILDTHVEGINFVPMVDQATNMPNMTTRGFYDPASNTISVNNYILERDNSYLLFNTVIHEMRHAYQWETIDDPSSHIVSKITLEEWIENRTHYISFNGNNYIDYISQPVEFDAESFAKQRDKIDEARPTYRGGWIE